ncbi:hypothetical protein ACPPVU_21455 [Mucilaginibacter sp. McL0603]|uniref:hypothetical protein n=1 Tax=Mucilaginibacter sp. McL0603 TaxID=3415670 RepID=UPI003CEDB968
MYLEVYVFNAPIVTEEQIYDEATLPDFPDLDILKKKVEEQVPGIKWLDAKTGQIYTSGHQGQLLFDNNRKAIYFRITGGDDPIKLVLKLCEVNGWTSYTPENGHFLEKNLDSVEYWREYCTYQSTIYNLFYKKKG